MFPAFLAARPPIQDSCPSSTVLAMRSPKGSTLQESEDRTVTYTSLKSGDPAPWFCQQATNNPNFAFDTAAGRYIVLCFFAFASEPQSRAALDMIEANR